MSTTVYVGVGTLELHVPEARSLKAKRSQTRSLLERLRNRHQVLVIEAGQQDLYQRATFAICAISTSVTDLEARFGRVERTVDSTWSGHVLGWEVDIIQV